jgi:hypothetical protein
MSSKITKLVKEAEAMMTTDEGDSNPQIAMLIKLVVETLRTVSATSKKATKAAKKGSGSDAEEKPKRKASAWASWVKDIKLAHPAEYEAFKTEHPEMKSHVISFAKEWKDTHADEYNIYVAARDLASDTESTGEKPAAAAKPKAKAEPKPKAKAEPKAKAAKPKAVKKAVGGAGAASAAISDSDSSDSDSD